MTTRRDFLRNTIAGGLAMGAMGPIGARAQSSDYKALVCILMRDGSDAHDILIPTGASAYATWAQARDSLLSESSFNRERSNLRPLGGAGSPAFGLPPELAELGDLYDQGHLGIVANVGPLMEPTTRQQLADYSVEVPPYRGSHNDQSVIWQTGEPEGATSGWGGRFMDQIGDFRSLTRVSIGKPDPWIASDRAPGVRMRTGSSQKVVGVAAPGSAPTELQQKLARYYRQQNRRFDNVFMRDVAALQSDAFDTADALIDVLGDQSVAAAFSQPGQRLSKNLSTVAAFIKGRSTLGAGRQVFLVDMKGFDTHQREAAIVPDLYNELARGLKDFWTTLQTLGVADQVTTFTMSEFGRTLQSNAAGTDHGWGNHHFVMGGAVKGGRVHGEIPPYDFGHEQDWRRGAMIPTLSVEQYAAPLGRWFGLDESGLAAALPRLNRFDSFAADII